MKTTTIRLFLAGICALATLGSPASAQCPPVPDGLSDGPCCQPAQAFIPQLPTFFQSAMQVCYLDCDVESTDICQAEWQSFASTPFTTCRVYSHKVKLRDGSGALKWRGRMRLRYSRTWLETDNAGNRVQVWRYLANGDMRPTAAAGTPPCPVPPCAASTSNRVRFTGYVDRALDCSTNTNSYAWMLTHACDAIDHAPGFLRAGTFHLDRSYTFVGPAAGFAPSPFLPIEAGSNGFEGVRRITKIPGTTIDQCEYEDRVQSTLSPINQFCLCGAPGIDQHYLGNLSAFGGCGTSITTPGGPLLPGFLSMSLGSWTDPTTYPGNEQLRWNAGNYDWTDCTGITTNDVYFGVTTMGGWFASQVPNAVNPGSPLPLIFVDQGNSLQGASPVMNVAFRSNRIINLNY